MFDNNQCAIQAYDSHYLSTELNLQKEMTATRTVVGPWEIFDLIIIDKDFVAFKAVNGKYMSLDEKSLQLFANADTIGEKEKFKLIYK